MRVAGLSHESVGLELCNSFIGVYTAYLIRSSASISERWADMKLRSNGVSYIESIRGWR